MRRTTSPTIKVSLSATIVKGPSGRRGEATRRRKEGESGEDGFLPDANHLHRSLTKASFLQRGDFRPCSVCDYNLEEATEPVNSVTYGLTAGIVTRSLSNVTKFANKAEVGVIKVNKPLPGLELQAPYTGFKNSGNDHYKEMGEEALEFCTRTKAVYVGY